MIDEKDYIMENECKMLLDYESDDKKLYLLKILQMALFYVAAY